MNTVYLDGFPVSLSCKSLSVSYSLSDQFCRHPTGPVAVKFHLSNLTEIGGIIRLITPLKLNFVNLENYRLTDNNSTIEIPINDELIGDTLIIDGLNPSIKYPIIEYYYRIEIYKQNSELIESCYTTDIPKLRSKFPTVRFEALEYNQRNEFQLIINFVNNLNDSKLIEIQNLNFMNSIIDDNEFKIIDRAGQALILESGEPMMNGIEYIIRLYRVSSHFSGPVMVGLRSFPPIGFWEMKGRMRSSSRSQLTSFPCLLRGWIGGLHSPLGPGTGLISRSSFESTAP